MLGPTLTERVGVAADRERVLARANAVARDLHDRLGHTLTAMTVQATAARRLLPTDPQATERALAAIEELGRRAQADVDGVVRALRDGTEDGTPAPAHPGRWTWSDIARALVRRVDAGRRLLVPEGLHVDHGCAETARAVIREADERHPPRHRIGRTRAAGPTNSQCASTSATRSATLARRHRSAPGWPACTSACSSPKARSPPDLKGVTRGC